MVACRDCIEYFTVYHIYRGKDLSFRPLKTLDPNLNAIAWGMIATWHVCAVAGTVLAANGKSPHPRAYLKDFSSTTCALLNDWCRYSGIIAHRF